MGVKWFGRETLTLLYPLEIGVVLLVCSKHIGL
jgi:hypothetical protein